MSTESTLALLKDYHDAWERGDQEAGMAFYADDVVVHMGGTGPLAGVYRGRESFSRDWIGRVADYTDSWDVEGNDVLIAGEDGVLLMVRETWTRGDQRVTTQRLGSYKFSGRQIVECYFSDMNQAEVEGFFGDLS
jgi:ketosteroid isomerase-like protein